MALATVCSPPTIMKGAASLVGIGRERISEGKSGVKRAGITRTEYVIVKPQYHHDVL